MSPDAWSKPSWSRGTGTHDDLIFWAVTFIELTTLLSHNRVINHAWRLPCTAQVPPGSVIPLPVFLPRRAPALVPFMMIIPAAVVEGRICKHVGGWPFISFQPNQTKGVRLRVSICRPPCHRLHHVPLSARTTLNPSIEIPSKIGLSCFLCHPVLFILMTRSVRASWHRVSM